MTESITFDHAAGYYDETRGFPPGVAAHIGALFRDAGKLARDSRVIEVGIGTGRIALPLGAHVGMVAGIDLARPMLHRLIAKRDGAPVHPVEGDATRLPYPAAAFDAAVDVNVFHLIPGWQDALREIARVLKPGGVLLHGWIDTPHADADTNPDVLGEVWDSVVRPLSQPNVGVPREEFAAFLPDQGWRQIGETYSHTYTRTSTPAELIDRLERRVWSSLWRLDDDVIERGIAAVRATMQTHGIDPAQTRETATRFNVAVYAPPTK